MTLYYAMGGGLGHLTRARVYLSNTGISQFRVLTGHPMANTVFKKKQLLQVPVSIQRNPAIYRQWFVDIIQKLKLDHLIIDTFPNGILGEIQKDLLNAGWKITYITRRMKWQSYVEKAAPFPVDQVVLLETPEIEHFQYLQQLCQNIKETVLDYSTIPVNNKCLANLQDISLPIWLIIHSEPKEELEELLAYARQKAAMMGTKPYYLVISNCKIDMADEGRIISHFPAWAYYPVARCIFSGCGFNSMQVPVPAGVPHYFLPFLRKYDDQHWRAQAKRNDQLQIIQSNS